MQPRSSSIACVLLALATACSSAEPNVPAPEPNAGPAMPAAAPDVAAHGEDGLEQPTAHGARDEPDAVSAASPAYQPGPSVVAGGSVDGAALRARIHERIERDTSPVHVLANRDVRALGQAICEAAVPRVPASVPVLLKPNIGGFAWFRSPRKHDGDDGVRGRTTDPEFVRGVIQCLRARGHERITIAEGWSAKPGDWTRLMKVSGYADLARAEGVALVALNDDGVFDVGADAPGKPLAVTGMDQTSVPTLLMPALLAEYLDKGLVISVPKIKTHRFSVTSMAIKGMQGTIMYSDASPAYRQKWRSHRELSGYLDARKQGKPTERADYVRILEIFARRMVDVLEVEAPHVVLAEGAPAMWGDGFNQRYPGSDSVAIGGTNPVFVDAVGARYLGLFDSDELARELGGHRTSPLIELAAERFSLDLAKIVVKGDAAALVDAPRPLHFIAMAPFELHRDGPAPAPGDRPGAPAARDTRPVASARFTARAIELDGAADEAIWRDIEPVVFSTDYAGVDTGVTTRARFAWSADALYGFVELEGTELHTDTSRPVDVERDGLYKEDCFELFLVPDDTRPSHYYEVEIGPYGHFLDIEIDRDKQRGRFDQSWSSGVRVATKRWPDERRATIEFALESPDITGLLRPGARLRMGLYRMDGRAPGKRYLAWSPPRTAKPNFHVPEAFGVLVLER